LSIKLNSVGEKEFLLLCDKVEITTLPFIETKDIFEKILKIKDPELLMIYLPFWNHENEQNLQLLWSIQFLKKEDLMKIFNYRKSNEMISLDEMAEAILNNYKK